MFYTLNNNSNQANKQSLHTEIALITCCYSKSWRLICQNVLPVCQETHWEKEEEEEEEEEEEREWHFESAMR